MGVVFLAGAYCVGKSTVSKELLKTISIPIFSASKLIFEESGVDYKFDKEVEDIDKNQKILIENVRNISKIYEHIILDGHFILLNSSSEIERIPDFVYRGLNLEAIILITANPETVIKRLYKRDGKEYNLDLVKKMIVSEASHAKYISDLLKVPLYQYINNDTSIQIDGIVDYLRRLGK